MKRAFVFLCIAVLSIQPARVDAQQHASDDKILVVYFSRTGNTKLVAEQIHELAGGNIVEIELQEPYPDDYDAVVERARYERDTKYKRPIKTKIENIDAYDIIFIGHPIWGMDIAASIRTFLSAHDLKGKTIVPFCTHKGYGPGSSVSSMKEIVPQAVFLEGFDIEGEQANTALPEVRKWLQEIKLLQNK